MKIPLLLICTSIVLLLLLSAPTSFAQNVPRVEVTSATKSMKGGELTIVNNLLFIPLENIGSKPIFSCEILKDNMANRFLKQFRAFDDSLTPGDSDSFGMGPIWSSGKEIKIRIAAVCFSDDTCEGEEESVMRLNQYSRGRRIAKKKLLPYVEGLIKKLDPQKGLPFNKEEYSQQFQKPPDLTESEALGYDFIVGSTFMLIDGAAKYWAPKQIRERLDNLKQNFEKDKTE